jgi:hypothetical protein
VCLTQGVVDGTIFVGATEKSPGVSQTYPRASPSFSPIPEKLPTSEFADVDNKGPTSIRTLRHFQGSAKVG